MSKVAAVTDKSFDADVVKHDGITVVDFWAEWCGPCKQMSPILDELAEKDPEVSVLKLDVDHNPSSAEKYSIRGIPTLLFFKDGKIVSTKVGVQSLDNLLKIISDLK